MIDDDESHWSTNLVNCYVRARACFILPMKMNSSEIATNKTVMPMQWTKTDG